LLAWLSTVRTRDSNTLGNFIALLLIDDMAHDSVVFQIKCRNFSFLLMKSISLASKLRQSQLWRTKICAAKIRKFSRISEKSAASAKDLKNPRYRIVLVNDLLQIGFSPALPSSSISASSFDLNNYSAYAESEAAAEFWEP